MTAITDSNGTVSERYAYDAYGNTTIYAANGTTERTGSAKSNFFTFTGRFNHSGLKLHYFRARMYDPALGRFISRDPLGYVDGMSLYKGYFAVNGLDPFGLSCNDDIQEVEARRQISVWYFRGTRSSYQKYRRNLPLTPDSLIHDFNAWSKWKGVNDDIGDIEVFLHGTYRKDQNGKKKFLTVHLDWPETHINQPYIFWTVSHSVKGTLSAKYPKGNLDECISATAYFTIAIDQKSPKVNVVAGIEKEWMGISGKIGVEQTIQTKKERVQTSIRVNLKICTDGTNSTKANRVRNDRYKDDKIKLRKWEDARESHAFQDWGTYKHHKYEYTEEFIHQYLDK